MWSEHDDSRPRDFSLDDFMATPIAEKFYRLWVRGEVTDNLIGRRFGYGALGRFYGKRDWESSVFDGMEDEPPDVLATGSLASEGTVAAAERENVENENVGAGTGGRSEVEGVENGSNGEADNGDAPVSSVATPGTGTSERAVSSTEAGFSGSRQTSLSHWLL